MKDTLNDGAIIKKLKPFKKFWTMFSPKFISLIHTLTISIRGEEALKHKTNFIKGYETYLENCKKSQRLISFEIIFRLDDIKKLEAEKKEHHRNKNNQKKDECINSIKLKKIEIIVLRRCIDSLIWSIFDNEPSSIRRLPISQGTDNLSKENIIDSMVAADLINKNKQEIAIVSDMSTFVHVGDLVTFTIQGGFQLVEIKTGEKNLKLYKAAELSITSSCPHYENIHTESFNQKDLNHYNRIKKQIVRGMNALEAIHTGKGYDNLNKSQVIIEDQDYIPEFYSHRLVNMWNIIQDGKDWAIDVVDECLFLGAYCQSEMGFVAFNSWMDGLGVKGRVVNINDSFSDALSRPFFSLPLPTDLLTEIISGKILIVMCFDYQLFLKRADKIHPGLYFLSTFTQDQALIDKTLYIEDKAIATNVDGQINFVGSGYETRILFDLHRPDNLIEWSYARSDLKKQNKE